MSQTAQALPLQRASRVGTYLGVILAIFVGAFLVTLVFSVLLYQVMYFDLFYPGVSAAGVDLGGRSWDEGVALLDSRSADYAAYPLILRHGERTWAVSPQEWGIRLNPTDTAMHAWAVGRRGPFWRDLWEQLYVLVNGYTAPVELSFDEEAAALALGRLAQEINTPAHDARLVLNNDLSIVAVPERPGQVLNVPASLETMKKFAKATWLPALTSQAQVFTPNSSGVVVDLVVDEVLPTVVGLEEARAELQNAIGSPLVLAPAMKDGAEHRQAVDPAKIAGWLSIQQLPGEGGQSRLSIAVDEAQVRKLLDDLATQIDQEVIDARFDFDPATGKLTPTQTDQEGRSLDVAVSLQRVLAQVLSERREVELPVTITPPQVSAGQPEKLGIKELAAEATTYFKGSAPARMRNIQVAAAKFQGIVVPPGEMFSFNKYLGQVSAANGFEDSLVIWGDRTAVGIGGGVCQVSTTAFRAAFWGGYEITERWAHGYRVSWYEPPVGLDATVYAPDVDFRFRNDTPYYLLIQTETNLQAATVTFRFYGTKPNRTVEMTEPLEENPVPHGPDIYQEEPTLPKGTTKQVDWAKDGLDVTVKRIVKEGDTVIHQDTFFSRYKPWQAVYLVGTKE
jgi:vancomycin resistance protein YoaR